MRATKKTPIRDWFGFLMPTRKVGRSMLSNWIGPYPECYIVEMTEQIINSKALYALIQQTLRGDTDPERVFGKLGGLAEIEWEGIRHRDAEGLDGEKL